MSADRASEPTPAAGPEPIAAAAVLELITAAAPAPAAVAMALPSNERLLMFMLMTFRPSVATLCASLMPVRPSHGLFMDVNDVHRCVER
ncbi:hypothetical protein GCM10017771_68560 [Streptomyces capitiformicae]|uniref:Uncharacterized protein n=1 Tax=Streptomyces capitiformicae TaxID=2014920 RepID=A0A919DJ29_9ACTN|nr:hypothetical protein GCM10017771_68560 [Streptomyces capitiformicae]